MNTADRVHGHSSETANLVTASTDWDGSLQLRMFRWASAGLLAAGMHVGVVLFFLYPSQSTDADIEGSLAVELAPIEAGSPIEMPNVPPGPLAPEQTAASEATKQIPKSETAETVAVDPSPLAPNPEVSLPLQRDEKEHPEKENAEKAERESQASAASLAAAPPRLERNNSLVPVAPAIGVDPAARQAQASWEKSLVSHLNRFKRYPAAAHTHHIEGQVSVQFSVDHTGAVLESQVVQSSGSPLLDDEAMAMLRRAAPLPRPPAAEQGSTFVLVLPIRFKIRD